MQPRCEGPSSSRVGHGATGGSKELLTSEDLVEEDLDVVGGEGLRRHDHLVEVALHQLCYHVAAGGAVKEK